MRSQIDSVRCSPSAKSYTESLRKHCVWWGGGWDHVWSGAADITFGTAARESMDLMTASPGVLYNVDGVFRNGPVKGKILPGFNLDTRKPLAENTKSSTSAMYSPKLASKVRREGRNVAEATVVLLCLELLSAFDSGRWAHLPVGCQRLTLLVVFLDFCRSATFRDWRRIVCFTLFGFACLRPLKIIVLP